MVSLVVVGCRREGASVEPPAAGSDLLADCVVVSVDHSGEVPEWVGRTKADVRRCEGEPDQRTGTVWSYRRPRGCSDEVEIMTFRFEGPRVTAATVEQRITGAHCAEDPADFAD
jgi:hypothetical protein